MPRYDALVQSSVGDRYPVILMAFKEVCAKIFSTDERTLRPRDFYGPETPDQSVDLPDDASVVFMLILDSAYRELLVNQRDNIADLIARQVQIHTGLPVRVQLVFTLVGWSFMKPRIGFE